MSLNRYYYGYNLIGAAFVAQLVAIGVTNYAAGPFLVPMTVELGWSRSEYASSRAFSYFVMAAVGFLIGGYVDRYGPRRFMLAGVVFVAGSLWLLGYTQSVFFWMCINGFTLSVGAALMGNFVANVTLSKWFVEKRGLAVAIAAMGVSCAGLTVTPAATWAIEHWGWRAAWQMLAVFALVFGAPVALMMRRSPADHGLHPDGKTDAQVAAGEDARASADYARSMTRAQAVRTVAFYLMVVAFGLFTMNISVILLHGIPYLSDHGFSAQTGAMMLLVTSIPAMVSKPFWGYLLDRVEARLLAALASITAGIALLAIVYSVTARSEVGAYVAFFTLGVGWGGMIPIQEVIWAGYFGRRYLGAIRGAALPFALVLSASAPLLVAVYYDYSGDYSPGLLAVAGASMVSALLLGRLPAGHR